MENIQLTIQEEDTTPDLNVTSTAQNNEDLAKDLQKITCLPYKESLRMIETHNDVESSLKILRPQLVDKINNIFGDTCSIETIEKVLDEEKSNITSCVSKLCYNKIVEFCEKTHLDNKTAYQLLKTNKFNVTKTLDLFVEQNATNLLKQTNIDSMETAKQLLINNDYDFERALMGFYGIKPKPKLPQNKFDYMDNMINIKNPEA